MFGQRIFRGGRPTRLGPIESHPDPHRMTDQPDLLGITPPYTRDWGQYQTFWNGNQYPGMGFNQAQYQYPQTVVQQNVPGTATFQQMRGGAISRQVGAVTIGQLLDKMRAAWASSQS